MACDCSLCQRNRSVAARLRRMRPAARSFWDGIYSDLEHAEMDRDINAAVIDGSWPQADEIIAGQRRTTKAAGGENG